MSKNPPPKKAKRGDDRIVAYVRMKQEDHAMIAQIAEKRGYPHTIASVAAEMISRGLKTETPPSPEARP
jgi:molybdenum cofactor biosynthesis enzyme